MNANTMELIKMLMPLIVLNYLVVGICLRSIFKHGVRNLNKGLWALIVIVVNTFGPIIFLLAGRKTTHD